MSIKIASLNFPINKNSNKKIAYSKRLKQEQSTGFVLHINKDTAVINVAIPIIANKIPPLINMDNKAKTIVITNKHNDIILLIFFIFPSYPILYDIINIAVNLKQYHIAIKHCHNLWQCFIALCLQRAMQY